MMQEEKQLLMIDLCARLPYGVICDMWFERNEAGKITEVLKCGGLMRLMNQEFDFVAKPYLRPMSSMTEEEEKEFKNSCKIIGFYKDGEFACTPDGYDWLNEHHFDYRGLIEKGLALEAPADMYKND